MKVATCVVQFDRSPLLSASAPHVCWRRPRACEPVGVSRMEQMRLVEYVRVDGWYERRTSEKRAVAAPARLGATGAASNHCACIRLIPHNHSTHILILTQARSGWSRRAFFEQQVRRRIDRSIVRIVVCSVTCSCGGGFLLLHQRARARGTTKQAKHSSTPTRRRRYTHQAQPRLRPPSIETTTCLPATPRSLNKMQQQPH